MLVRWSPQAALDLERICDRISQDSPETSRGTAEIILKVIGTLRSFPNRGRLGRVDDTRELILAPLPYVVVYEVSERIEVLRVLHGAQKWT